MANQSGVEQLCFWSKVKTVLKIMNYSSVSNYLPNSDNVGDKWSKKVLISENWWDSEVRKVVSAHLAVET